MNRLFRRYDDDEENYDEKTYAEECQKIWDYINFKGEVYFNRSDVDDLWRDYSYEEFCAGFMRVTDATLEHFIDWMENYEE